MKLNHGDHYLSAKCLELSAIMRLGVEVGAEIDCYTTTTSVAIQSCNDEYPDVGNKPLMKHFYVHILI